MPPGEGIRLELVEESELSGVGTPAQERPRRYRAIVNCGKPVKGMEIEIRECWRDRCPIAASARSGSAAPA
jgi:fatty-acyl-CoA synthase